jgi:E3 ubiquitin-protein ligase RNF14
MEINVDLEVPRTVVIENDGSALTPGMTDLGATAPPERLLLSTLPAILLEFSLPPNYPISNGPEIKSLHVTNNWLAESARMRHRLQEMFQPGDGVLYDWMEWIRTAKFLEEMGFIVNEDGEDVVRYICLPVVV